MKNFKLVAGAALFAVLAGPTAAFEWTGSDLNFKYSRLNEKVGDDRLDAFFIDGAVEVGFTRSFALQFDLGYHNFGVTDANGYNAALHGLFHLNESFSFGAFYGQDEVESATADFYGIEAGYESGRFEIEGYVGQVDGGLSDATIYGALGSYGITDTWDLTGAIEAGDLDVDADLTRLELGVRYNVSPSTAFTATVGSFDASVGTISDSETFVTVGAEFTFGAERGATFGRRGFMRLLPGL